MSSLFYKLIFVNALISVLVARFYYSSDDDRKIYIVYMGSKPEDTDSAHLHHKGMLKEVVGRNFAPEYVICTYHKSFNGFAVKLTEKEAQKIADKEGVVSVFEDEKHEVETTKSWDFLGFPRNVPRLPQEESEIIVGVFDTGISPDSASFNDKGFGPPPDKWKGICQTLAGFHCNKKIIGARVYMKDGPLLPGEVMSPIDTDGHGTHVASIVAGGLVDHANLEGLAEGMARGGVPSARIAVYKVCWSDGCATHQVLRAFDDAIDDGVDIISYSIGAKVQKPYFQDPFTIGAFHAMKKGVLTSKSAGNNGHKYSTVTGIAPWVLSVAATTTNRNFVTDVRLGNNHAYQGYTVNTFDLKGKQYSLIYGGDAPNPTSTKSDSSVCKENSVNVEMVKGKILVCDSLQYASTFKYLINGPVGVLMQDNRPKNDGRSYPMAASHLSRDRGGTEIEEYMSSTKNPTATILKSNTVYDGTVKVVHFSSRGPNTITKNIIKPDLAAPGVQILAAWSPTAPVSQVEGDPRRTLYNIISGTSMACPHASAAAMYVKTFHPTWSPAAIKSALMTTGNHLRPFIC
ncbi:cucumisin-like isoform X2 [Momordica charantia]|uniref:Cucumisin-like isoform X2 n=1 Tax=Momordica charantia TaxID=3673 RepID=A0A6J1CC57_MOMCH|nr:cucumisin-like isoform X2 [Momordica charantia]